MVKSARQAASPSAGIVRSCQTREESVKNRLAQLTDLVTNMVAVFDRHATRVQNYYLNTLVPQGKTHPRYDALVAEIKTKKTAVDTALTKTKTDASGFSCSTGDPRELLTQFRTDMQATKKALKDYRTAIKNLIVVVSSLAPKPTTSPSPSPVVSPSPSPTL